MASVLTENVRVDFPIYHGNSRSLKRTVFAAASGRLQEDSKHRIVVNALRDISLDLRSGDRLGLIGGNGAGKTTLLRTLAGIYEPVEGRVVIEGRIGALLDATLGMNYELTGRENIALRGLYNGLSREAIGRLEDDVETFAELGDFLDLPMRFYSAGMVVRLGFALATAIRPEVLLMDEWLLAGDAAFIEKASVRLETVVRQAEILVLSSHMPAIILNWSTRVIRMHQGRIVDDGAPQEVMDRYLSGKTYHALIDPERDVPEDSTRIHGITRAHLAGKPRFAEIADALLAFLGDAPLIAHNAPFDFGFIDAELMRIGQAGLDRARMIDTAAMARLRFPGLPNSLDALCRRYGIDLSERTSHNALLDCRLLSDVYVELTGGRQPNLLPEDEGISLPLVAYQMAGERRPVLLQVDADALARHTAFVARLKESVWLS